MPASVSPRLHQHNVIHGPATVSETQPVHCSHVQVLHQSALKSFSMELPALHNGIEHLLDIDVVRSQHILLEIAAVPQT